MSRKPLDERRRGWLRCRQLPKRNPNGGAAEPVARNGHRVGSSPGDHGIDDVAFERHQLCHPITFEQDLKGCMILLSERALPAELIAQRMRRIDMRAGNPAFRQRLRRRVGATMRQ